MTVALELPALRGDDPLGFLAALGVLRLTTVGLERDARLAFVDGPVTAAVLEVEDGTTLDGLAKELEALARTTYEAGRLLVGVASDFPPRKVGAKGGDPARLERGELAIWGRSAASYAAAGEPEMARWLLALFSSRSLDEKGRAAMTPFYAPSGQMTLGGSLAEPLKIVATEPGHVEAAFTRWRRVAGFTGANLDLRALRDAGVEPSGKPANRGAPGPTWLALEGLAVGRVSGREDRAPAVLWQRRRASERRHRQIGMVWPTWRYPLDLDAARVLLEHPAVRLPEVVDRKAGERRALGVNAIWRSERAQLSQSDGPLGSAQRVWPEG